MPECIDPGMEVSFRGEVAVVLKISGDGLLGIAFISGGFTIASVRYCQFTATLDEDKRKHAFETGLSHYARVLRDL